MPLTPQDVQQKEFRQQFRGYNEVEVDAFLDEVEVELGRLLGENESLRQRLSQSAAAPSGMAEGDEMLRRTLLLAQRTADETVSSAQAEAQRLLDEARTQAQQALHAANDQAQAAVGDLDRRRQQLEHHIEGLRAFEREYRTRLKAYLESQLRDLDGRGQAAGPTAGAAVASAAAPTAGPSPTPSSVVPPPPSTPPPAAHPAGPPTFTPVPPTAAPARDQGRPTTDPEIPRVAP